MNKFKHTELIYDIIYNNKLYYNIINNMILN